MAHYRIHDWANMTVADVAKLTKREQEKYINWLEGQKIRKKNQNSFNDENFSEFLSRSCSLYSNADRVQKTK